uniref:Xylulose kinase-1 n=1 Tax=Tanacetum cinerariifolium TaxID=118510 RepID=A0A6L2M9X4_TANCI|nr:hypothetical protein [Tanacetum cinerariifolium]
MVAILEKIEHNTDFHQIVDFLKASHIRYALTISPTVYVSHIRRFWSTVRIETTNQETKILATVDGKPRTIFESSLRRHLKLNDEEGISSLPDAELFENLSLMGYNILPNQSNIATYVVCLDTNRVYNFSKMIFDGMGEGSANPIKPHHTPSPQEQHSPHHDSPPLSHLTTTSKPIPQAPTETLTPRRYTRRTIQIAQSKALSPVADELSSLLRDDRQGEAFPTVSCLDAWQDREKIAKTSALPHESSPSVTFLDADEGKPTQKDAPITGGIKEIKEELGADKSTELGSNDTEEMVNVLSSIEAGNILTSRGAAASVSPGDVLPTVGVPTVSGSFPTASEIFTTASVKVVESKVPKKRKLQEQIDAQVAREMKEEFAKENQRVSEQLARDYEITRLHAEEELKMMIEGLDKNNEVIAKHLREYEQAVSKPFSKKEQREFYMSVLRSHVRWKTKHFRGMTLEQIKEKFIPVWKQLEDFISVSSKEESERVKKQGLKIDQGSSKRMKTFKSVSEDVSEEELKGMIQLVPLEEVYFEALQVKHHIIDWEIHSEGKREYWKIIRLGGHTTVYQFFIDMLKQFDREDLHQLWTLVKETFSIRQATKDKKKELWVELKRLFEPDFED